MKPPRVESLRNSVRGLRARAEDLSLPEGERLRAEIAYRTGMLAAEVEELRAELEETRLAVTRLRLRLSVEERGGD